jgi:hypothetical protein
MLGAEHLCLGFVSDGVWDRSKRARKPCITQVICPPGLFMLLFPVWNAACFYKDTCDGQTEQGNKIPPRDPKEQDPWFRSMQSAQSELRF